VGSVGGRTGPKRMVEDRRYRYGVPNSSPRVDGVVCILRPVKGEAMPDEQLSEFTAKIVAAYLQRNLVPADQLGTLISTVHQALGGLGRPAELVVERTPAVSIRRSVHRDYVVCLDCGWSGQMLRRHLATTHGLTVEQYRARWNLPADHAMTAPAYSERRSTMAKQLGLGRGRASGEVSELAATETSATAPRRRGRPKSAAPPA